jgi:hypothetical protein
MTIYLYKKTHNKTGLMYLGKTTRNPYKYKGSGDYWIPHINKHGYDVTTEILRECQTNEEVKEWANLKPEEGTGGFNHTPELTRKQLESRRRNGTLNVTTPESVKKKEWKPESEMERLIQVLPKVSERQMKPN